jgi:hypothetical protein
MGENIEVDTCSNFEMEATEPCELLIDRLRPRWASMNLKSGSY